MDAQLLSALAKVYESVLEPEKWEQALVMLGACVKGYGGQFMVWDENTQGCAYSVIKGAADEANDLYTSYYAAIDPRLAYAMKVPAGKWVLCHQICDDRHVSRSEFYQDFLLPTGTRYMTGTKLLDDSGQHAMICFGRHVGDRPFAEEDDRLLASITPHLQLAARLQLKLWELQDAHLVYASVLDRLEFAALVVDGQGYIHHMNFRARETLRRSETDRPFRVKQAKLLCRDASAQLQLYANVRSATAAPAQGNAFRISQGAKTWSCVTLPIAPAAEMSFAFQRPMALVMLFDLCSQLFVSDAVLAALFNLTPAECKVACAVANGSSVKGCAATQGVSTATVKSQLLAVYSKMGIGRQSELTAIFGKLSTMNH